MAIAPWVIKGLIGLGGISVVGVGGLVIHKGYLSWDSKPQLGWRVEIKNERKSPHVIASVINWPSLDSEEWICQIWTTSFPDDKKPEGISSQIKEELGIKDDGTTDETKKSKLDRFIENCENYRFENQQNSDSKNIMVLEDQMPLDLTPSYNRPMIDKHRIGGFQRLLVKNYLKRKFIDSLGIPYIWKSFESSDFPDYEIDDYNLKRIWFGEIKKSDKINSEGDTKVTLKIEEKEGETFPRNLRFTFVTKEGVTIWSETTDDDPVDLNKGTTEFRMKINDDRSYSLERIWNITILGEKVGLTCPKDADNSSICNLKTGNTINVWNSDDSYIIGATFEGDITFEEDQQDHNQGFKFTTTSDIELKEAAGATKQGSEWKIEANPSTSYEIKLKKIQGVSTPTWFLSKVTPAA